MKLNSKSINYNVQTVDELLSLDGLEGDTVVVTDENRGGVFVYREDNVGTNNEGTIFNGWTRQYSGAVNVKWFGAVGDGVTDDTTSIQTVLSLSNKLIIFDDAATYLVKQLTPQGTNLHIEGMGSTIKFNEDINGYAIRLTDSTINNLIFDGNDKNIGDNGVSTASCAMVSAYGDFFAAKNCTFKNLQGVQDNYQYGLIVDPAANAMIESCIFDNIKTATNTAGNGGFCGGVFFYNEDLATMKPANQTVINCTFNDIYTTKNAADVVYWDSDGVRSYYYYRDSGYPDYDAAVKDSTITVQGCSFKNVLKSAVKVNHCVLLIDNCTVSVDDVKDQGQTHSYVGFRYQVGHNVKITNCSVVGKIRSGWFVAGDNSHVSNCYFGASDLSGVGVYSSGMIVGQTDNNVLLCTIDNCNFSGTEWSIDIYGSDVTMINNCNLVGDITAINATDIVVNNCYLDSMVDNGYYSSYNPTIEKIVFSNCKVSFAKDGYYANNILTDAASFNFIMKDTKIENCRGQLVECTVPHNIKLENCNIDITSTYTAKRLLEKTADGKIIIKDLTVTDTRANSSNILIYTNSTSEDVIIDGLDFTANASANYGYGLYLAPSAGNITMRNLTLRNLPDGARVSSVSGANIRPSISNVRADFANASMHFYNTTNAVVNMFHGTLAATHITTGGTVTVAEYNTTKW